MSNTGLFQEKKLIIIAGAPADKSAHNKISSAKLEELIHRYEDRHDHLHDDIVVIRISIDPDKRTRGYKYISTHTQIKEFKTYSAKELVWRMQTLTHNLIESDDLHHVIDMVWSDMYRLEHECHKLTQFAHQHQVPKLTRQDIHKLIRSQEDDNVFTLLHAMISKPSDAYHELSIAQASATDWNKYHGWLMRGLRTLYIVILSYLEGIHTSSTIASAYKLNARGVSTILRQYTITQSLAHQVQDLLESMVWLEYQIKTGIVPDSYYRLEVKKLTTALHY
jgi:DNA polymerase III delta subunit